eukprot:2111681-Ditylum_brightwellii.AAC.1
MAGSGGITYPNEVSMPTAYTSIAKLLINSTISTAGARYMCANPKNFYLGTPIERHEFMQLPLNIIPKEIIQEYDTKYQGKEHIEHVLEVPKQHYKVAEDWSGTRYCGITIDWDYSH